MNRTIFMVASCLVFAAEAQQRNNVSIGMVDSVYSNILKESRKILVYVPKSYAINSRSMKYPVAYLLDGETNFHSFTGVVNRLEGDIWPEMIVVGIVNTNRSRDLTPTHSLIGVDGKEQNFLKDTGGGERFTQFLSAELMPYMESHYSIAPHRLLIGHSFGGLMVIHMLVNHPELFNAFLAIDPSLWWDDQKLTERAFEAFRTRAFTGKSLFLGVANTVPLGMDTAKAMTDKTADTYHFRSIVRFGRKPQPVSNGLKFDWKYYADDDHGSVALISEYDGLRFLYNYYKAPKLSNPGKTTAALLSDHFKKVTDQIGYPVNPPEALMNGWGYSFMQQKEMEKAHDFFQTNVKNYPGSANVYDSMGDYYVAMGDTKNAKEYFSKALSLGNSPETKKKLEKLKLDNATKH